MEEMFGRRTVLVVMLFRERNGSGMVMAKERGSDGVESDRDGGGDLGETDVGERWREGVLGNVTRLSCRRIDGSRQRRVESNSV